MAVLHVVDFVMQNRAGTPQAGIDAIDMFKKRAAETHAGFNIVNRFALASKHGALKRGPGYDMDRHRGTFLSFWGTFRLGRTFLGDKTGGIAVDLGGGSNVNLLKALDATMARYRAEFPEAFSLP